MTKSDVNGCGCSWRRWRLNVSSKATLFSAFAPCCKWAKTVLLRISSFRIDFRSYLIIVAIVFATLCFSAYQYHLWVTPFSYRDLGGCKLPVLDPWDASIRWFLPSPIQLKCRQMQPELTYLDEDGWLRLNASATRIARIALSNLNCSFRSFDHSPNADSYLIFGAWQALNGSAKVAYEFVEVQCSLISNEKEERVYLNLHNQVVVKRSVNGQKTRATPSVLLFVLDGMSRSNFFRYLPKTVKVLQVDYSATVFDGFIKLADNSFPNALAFLTGKFVHDTGSFSKEILLDQNGPFDDWPLLFFNYSRAGYRTLFAEDLWRSGLFSYLKKSFKQTPTDHYMRPFWYRLYQTFLGYSKSSKSTTSTEYCCGNTPCHLMHLRYLRQFLTKYPTETAKFALSWLIDLGHDYIEQASIADDDLADFFRQLRAALADTFVFVFGDHGNRYTFIRQLVVGRIEEQMPFFSVALPDRLRRTHPHLARTLASNAGQTVTSFFDLYATLADILVNGADGFAGLNGQEAWSPPSTRGMSLLRPIPRGRTCHDAGVSVEYCVCQQEASVSVQTDANVTEAAQQLVRHLNHLLKNHSNVCANLTIKEIKSAQLFVSNPKAFAMRYVDSSGSLTYRVTVEANPSLALFEGTLTRRSNDRPFAVVGDVSRINMYGNQSSCIDDAVLRKYCYC